jgi:hypothetical protein
MYYSQKWNEYPIEFTLFFGVCVSNITQQLGLLAILSVQCNITA